MTFWPIHDRVTSGAAIGTEHTGGSMRAAEYTDEEIVIWHEAAHFVVADILGVHCQRVMIRNRENGPRGIVVGSWDVKGARAALISLAGPVSDAMHGYGRAWLARGPSPLARAPEEWRLDLKHAEEMLAAVAPSPRSRRALMRRCWATVRLLLHRHDREFGYVVDTVLREIEAAESETVFVEGDPLRDALAVARVPRRV